MNFIFVILLDQMLNLAIHCFKRSVIPWQFDQMNAILTTTNTSAIIQFKANILLNALLPQIDLNLLIDS